MIAESPHFYHQQVAASDRRSSKDFACLKDVGVCVAVLLHQRPKSLNLRRSVEFSWVSFVAFPLFLGDSQQPNNPPRPRQVFLLGRSVDFGPGPPFFFVLALCVSCLQYLQCSVCVQGVQVHGRIKTQILK